MKKLKATCLTAINTAAASLLLITGSAMAADPILLNAVSGEVLVNQGESYAVPSANMEVTPGDQVMVNEGGFAKVTYPNGCVVEVTGSFILSVASESPCVAGALVATVGGATVVAASGVSTGVILGSVFGVAAFAAVLSEDDDDTISR